MRGNWFSRMQSIIAAKVSLKIVSRKKAQKAQPMKPSNFVHLVPFCGYAFGTIY